MKYIEKTKNGNKVVWDETEDGFGQVGLAWFLGKNKKPSLLGVILMLLLFPIVIIIIAAAAIGGQNNKK